MKCRATCVAKNKLAFLWGCWTNWCHHKDTLCLYSTTFLLTSIEHVDKNINDVTKELLKLRFALLCAGDNSVWAGTWLFVLGNPLGYGSKSIKWNGRQRVTKDMFRWTLSHFLCSKATWFLWRFCSWGWWGRWQGGCRWTPDGSSWYSICTITFTDGVIFLLWKSLDTGVNIWTT